MSPEEVIDHKVLLDELDERYNSDPPDGWVECGCCECWHPPDFWGDCRDDNNRWPFTRKVLYERYRP